MMQIYVTDRNFAWDDCVKARARAGARWGFERSVQLYRVMQENLETWLARREAAESESGGAPAWVEGELRRYLDCALLCHGFARARCAACGQDFLVAFSCKGRGVCPSCNARRMVEVAAHMVDNVFPRLPVRQWVLSFPKRLRYFLQRDAELSGRVLQVFLRAVETKLRASSPAAPADARLGGVTFVQRFGSTLNAHLHFHCCLIHDLPKPRLNAPSAMTLEPLELIDRLVVLIAPPRIHRHRYRGVLAPNARLRAAVTARANQAVEGVVAIPPTPETGSEEPAIARAHSAAVRMWAALLARIYEVLPLVCPNCKGEMRLIAFITERTSIEQILTHIGEPTVPPPITAARAPPGFPADVDQRPGWEIGAEPIPDIDFDQRQGW